MREKEFTPKELDILYNALCTETKNYNNAYDNCYDGNVRESIKAVKSDISALIKKVCSLMPEDK